MASDLRKNLRFLCAEEKSVSQVCRDLDINRQQFAKYLSGRAQPSASNRRRICRYFNIRDHELDAPHDQFIERLLQPRVSQRDDMFLPSFREMGFEKARRMAGIYHAHYMTPSHPDSIVRTFVQFVEDKRSIRTRLIERVRHAETGLVSRVRYDGFLIAHDDAFFMVDRDRLLRTGMSQTVLYPVHRGSQSWLKGLMLGYSWRLRKPYSTTTAWKKLRPGISLREAIEAADTYAKNSREIDPVARQLLETGSFITA